MALIFDNAEEPAALTRYLPGGGGHVLITSRNPGWQELAIPVGVDVFDRGESITLLRHRAPQLIDGEAERSLPSTSSLLPSTPADLETTVPDEVSRGPVRPVHLRGAKLLYQGKQARALSRRGTRPTRREG